jgi:hypothetical protein
MAKKGKALRKPGERGDCGIIGSGGLFIIHPGLRMYSIKIPHCSFLPLHRTQAIELKFLSGENLLITLKNGMLSLTSTWIRPWLKITRTRYYEGKEILLQGQVHRKMYYSLIFKL